MKKIELPHVAVALVFMIVSFGLFYPLDSCGCLTQERYIKGSVASLDLFVNEYYVDNGVYPSLEVVNEEVDLLFPVKPWDEIKEKSGIYYRQLDNGQDYDLVGYVEQETLFGRKVDNKIRPQTFQFLNF